MKAGEIILVHGAGKILPAQADLCRTLYLLGRARHGDAAFGMNDRLGAGLDDFRIDVEERPGTGRQFQHDEAGVDADMGGGNADARSGAHGIQKIVCEAAQRVVKTFHGLAGLRKTGIRVAQYFQNGHGISFLALSPICCSRQRAAADGLDPR